jgi:hypothetical protein
VNSRNTSTRCPSTGRSFCIAPDRARPRAPVWRAYYWIAASHACGHSTGVFKRGRTQACRLSQPREHVRFRGYRRGP